MESTAPLVAGGLALAYFMMNGSAAQNKAENAKRIDKMIKERVAVEQIEEMIKTKGEPDVVKFTDEAPASEIGRIETVSTPDVAKKMALPANFSVFTAAFDNKKADLITSLASQKVQIDNQRVKTLLNKAVKEKTVIDDSLKPKNELADGTEAAFPWGYSVPRMIGADLIKGEKAKTFVL